jgi:hypothetical protein
MALTFSIVDAWDDGQRIHVSGTVGATGNYSVDIRVPHRKASHMQRFLALDSFGNLQGNFAGGPALGNGGEPWQAPQSRMRDR